MHESELDELYGALCRMLQTQGEANALLVLARFSLLAMHEIDDAGRIRAIIDAAVLQCEGTESRARPDC